MSELSKSLIECAGRVESLFDEACARNENVRQLYESHLKTIITSIKSSYITAPSDALDGYWYYFSPEGPWNLWSDFPRLVSGISVLINVLNLKDDAEFEAYRERHRIQ